MESCGLAMRSCVLFIAFLSTLIALPVSFGSWYSLMSNDAAAESILSERHADGVICPAMRWAVVAFSVGLIAYLAASIVAYYGCFASLQLWLLVIGILCVVISAWTGMRAEGHSKTSLRLGWILLGSVNLVGWCFIGVVVLGSGPGCLSEF